MLFVFQSFRGINFELNFQQFVHILMYGGCPYTCTWLYKPYVVQMCYVQNGLWLKSEFISFNKKINAVCIVFKHLHQEFVPAFLPTSLTFSFR